MRTPDELFHILDHEIEYTKVGLDVDYNLTVYPEEKVIRLFFQGSRSKTDWILNFCFPVKAYKKQQNKLLYHAGWIKAYKSANDEIMTALIALCERYPDFEVAVLGHSLGGALAIYAAEDFYFRTGKKSTLITFGAPKAVFGKATKKRLLDSCKAIFQYAHKNDFVPMLPPCYRHLNKICCGKFLLKDFVRFPQWHTSYDSKDYYINLIGDKYVH